MLREEILLYATERAGRPMGKDFGLLITCSCPTTNGMLVTLCCGGRSYKDRSSIEMNGYLRLVNNGYLSNSQISRISQSRAIWLLNYSDTPISATRLGQWLLDIKEGDGVPMLLLSWIRNPGEQPGRGALATDL